MKNQKKKSSKYIAIIFIIIGFLIFLYPTIANLVAKLNQAEVIKDYSAKIETLDEEKILEEYQKAINYNLELIDKNNIVDPFMQRESSEEKIEYESILNINNDNVLGIIEIPKIDVKMPIYHGTSDEVIEKGVGHLRQSSFPIEGQTVHSVLTSHTGLPKAKLFTNLDKLEIGDLFYISILNKNFCYKVCDIKIVLPEEVDSLKVRINENLCTLITCTPYGVNSHRLLVTGEFTEYKEPQKENIVEKITKNENYLGLIVLLALIFLLLCIFIIKHKKRGNKK